MKIRIELIPTASGWTAMYTVTGCVPGGTPPVLQPRQLSRMGYFPAPPATETIPPPPSDDAGKFMATIRSGGAAATQLLDETYAKVTTRELSDTVPFGWYLYLTLLGEAAGGEVFKFLTDPQSCRNRVELQLVWDVSQGELTRLPWELMRDSTTAARAGTAGFLAALPRVVIGRRLVVGAPPGPPPKDLRVLFVVGTGPDEHWVRAGGEYLGVIRSVCEPYPFTSELILYADRARLAEAVQRFRPTVVHLIGHGSRGANGEPQVGFCTADRRGQDPVTGPELAQLLNAAPAEAAPELPWAVIINACHEAGTDDLSTPSQWGNPNDPVLRPVAVALVEAGVAMAVGMSGRVVDQSCRLFARKFYESVLSPAPVGSPGRVDVIAAVAAGRAAGVDPTAGQSNPAREVDWAMPAVVLNDAVAALPNWAATPEQVDWHEAAGNLRSPAEFPPVCGRIAVWDKFARLLEPVVPGQNPAGAALRFLVLASNSTSKARYGRTWLLREFASRVARAGHLPVHVREAASQSSATDTPGTAVRIGEAIKKTYIDFKLTLPTIGALGLPASAGAPHSIEKVVGIVRDDLAALRAAARKRLNSEGAMLVLLVDNLHGLGLEGVDVFLNDTYGLFETHGLLNDHGFRVACTYETNPGPAFDTVVSQRIVAWANRANRKGSETLAAFAGADSLLAYESLLLHWRPRNELSGEFADQPTPLVPSFAASRDKILSHLVSKSKGVPSAMLSLSDVVDTFQLSMEGPAALRLATDEDVIRTVRQQGGA